ncbi:Uncharacterised protein [Prevotella sp. MGM1]|mgnify:CR=1 FL=1|nr:Uncharacterised protein [Prevotella sp. MGM1]
MIMKKVLSVVLVVMLALAAHAQKDVTKFLGIPVDGSKSEIIQKLKAKGYKYNSTYDFLEGEFNGNDVHIYVVTDNNKVWRIMVTDEKSIDETSIKLRFNKLCRQFNNNKKYVQSSLNDFTIPEDEDISYEMLVHKKRYEASFFQLQGTENDNPYNRFVWFMIREFEGKYYITMFYDNEYNRSNGEDL